MRVAAETLTKEVYNELPNYNVLVPVILKEVSIVVLYARRQRSKTLACFRLS